MTLKQIYEFNFVPSFYVQDIEGWDTQRRVQHYIDLSKVVTISAPSHYPQYLGESSCCGIVMDFQLNAQDAQPISISFRAGLGQDGEPDEKTKVNMSEFEAAHAKLIADWDLFKQGLLQNA